MPLFYSLADHNAIDLLNSLITRHPHNRPGPSALPSHAFFSSLSISTLNFLDRSTFASKTREEKISFMKGLTAVLDRFSEGLKTRKILPSLMEEVCYPSRFVRSDRGDNKLFLILDERYAPAAIHFAECICHVTESFSNAVRITRAAKSETALCCQRTPSKHDYATR